MHSHSHSAADVKCKLLEDELHLWKEKHSLLEDKLQSVQKELSRISQAHHTSSAKAKESEALENARHPSKVDVGMNTEELEETEGGTCRALQESNSEYCSVMDDLLSLFQVLFYFAVSVGAGLGRSTFSIWYRPKEKIWRSMLQDYEKELTGLAASHLSEIDILKRQRGSSKHEVTISDQDYLESVIQEVLGHLELKVRSMKTKLKELRSVLESQASVISSLRTEITKKTDEIHFIMDEKVVGEEALQASQLECNELASLIKEIDGSMVQLTTALATRTLERDQASEARISTEQELRKRYGNLLSQLDEARNQVIKFQSELEERRAQQEEHRGQAEALKLELQNCTKRMENAERDVEQLKTLIIQLDITREELVGKLKLTTTKEQQAEKQVTALEAEVGRLRVEVETRTAEVSHTCSLLEVLSRERDHLQSELNNSKEKLALEDATRNRLEELWTSKSDEHRAAAEELATLKCEHQLLKINATQMSKDNAVLVEDLGNLTEKVNHFHMVQQQLFHQQNTEDMLHKAEEQVKLLAEENDRIVSDLKGLERQADFMTRSLNQQLGLLNDYENEKKVIVSQLSAAKVAINDLVAKLSTSLKEMTTLEEKHRKVSELLQDNMQEVERLSATASMEQERVKSLEHLLASLRAEELKLEMANKEAVSENLILKERISALQEQVNNLQITRNSQNQDIMRLQMSKNRARIQELEERMSSVTADLTKTTTLYKDCFIKLQKSESRFLELRKEFDHTLGLLSKVDEERMQLQQKCAELEGAALKLYEPSGPNSPIKHSSPDIAWMQQECHRLKKASSLLESSPEPVAISS
ncbi:hypothetical protein R1flu_003812 [Riccia fluitans]|uniref:Uncharacterized protein n=1 Tax=Riccia fluitans TaxID=41844 RepID=A0ABD1YA27_9MARC